MHSVVENQHIRARCLGGDDVRIRRAVTSAIHFSLMVDLHLNVDLPPNRSEAAKFFRQKKAKPHNASLYLPEKEKRIKFEKLFQPLRSSS